MIEQINISGDEFEIPLRIIEHKKSSAVLLILPAMGVKASYYDPLAHALSEHGLTIISAEWRGHGASKIVPSRNTDFGYQDLIDDIGVIVRFIAHRYPGQRIHIIGHSLGGQLGSLYSAKFPEHINSHIFIASCMVYYKGWSGIGKLKIQLVVRLFPIISSILGYLPGDKIGFAGREAKSVISDWSRNGRTGKYVLKGSSINYDSSLSKLNKRILSFSIDQDDFAPERAINNLLAKFSPRSDITQYHVTGNDAATERLNHFNWVKYNSYIIQKIVDWL